MPHTENEPSENDLVTVIEISTEFVQLASTLISQDVAPHLVASGIMNGAAVIVSLVGSQGGLQPIADAEIDRLAQQFAAMLRANRTIRIATASHE